MAVVSKMVERMGKIPLNDAVFFSLSLVPSYPPTELERGDDMEITATDSVRYLSFFLASFDQMAALNARRFF